MTARPSILSARPLPEKRIRTGAQIRQTGSGDRAVVCVNGGSRHEVPGTWSASVEYLVRRLAPRFPNLAFAEVRYRTKSWNRLPMCADDALAAVDEVGAARTLLIGYSMGGAVAVMAAGHPTVVGVLGLAPWLPGRLSFRPLHGKRLVVVHGALDRKLAGIPGVTPASSRRGFERARAAGVDGTYTIVGGAAHAIALRAPWGSVVPMPHARRWLALVAGELERFQAS